MTVDEPFSFEHSHVAYVNHPLVDQIPKECTHIFIEFQWMGPEVNQDQKINIYKRERQVSTKFAVPISHHILFLLGLLPLIKIIPRFFSHSNTLVWVRWWFGILFRACGARKQGRRKHRRTVYIYTVKQNWQNAINEWFIFLFSILLACEHKTRRPDEVLVQRSTLECHSCPSTKKQLHLNEYAYSIFSRFTPILESVRSEAFVKRLSKRY